MRESADAVTSMQSAEPARVTELVTRVLAPNPGHMTLEGTNSYLIGSPGCGTVVVVDPGPADAPHVRRLQESGRVELILLTHRHIDHVEAVAALVAATAAPVRAADPALCVDADPLRDGEIIVAGATRIRVMATPGHTADSVCFVLPDDADVGGEVGACASVITGDTILGRGSSVIAYPDGTLSDYLRSLELLRGLGGARVLPAHGPSLPSIEKACDSYLALRRLRLDGVRAALRELGRAPSLEAATVEEVTRRVYAGVEERVMPAARVSVRAHLAYLADQARPVADQL